MHSVYSFIDCTISDARCLLFQPPGCGNRLPQALCVVSQVSEPMLYDQLLRAVESRLRSVNSDSANDLLRTAYNSACPQPNHEINIRTAVCTYCTCDYWRAYGMILLLLGM